MSILRCLKCNVFVTFRHVKQICAYFVTSSYSYIKFTYTFIQAICMSKRYTQARTFWKCILHSRNITLSAQITTWNDFICFISTDFLTLSVSHPSRSDFSLLYWNKNWPGVWDMTAIILLRNETWGQCSWKAG